MSGLLDPTALLVRLPVGDGKTLRLGFIPARARSVNRVRILSSSDLNAYEVLKHKNLLLTKATVEHLAEVVHA